MSPVLKENQTKLEALNQQLRERDSLLNCVNLAAQCLVATNDLSIALPDVLEILGKGTRQCRAYILKVNWDDTVKQQIFSLMFEWDAPHIPTKLETGGRFPVAVDAFPERLTAPLRAGRATQFLARELDGIEAKSRQSGEARSLVGVPISVSGEWWGLLGLDDCLKERIWSDAEIAVLQTAATVIGNALEREQVRQAREIAKRKAIIEAETALLEERAKAARERAADLAKLNETIGRSLSALTATPELDDFLGQLLLQMNKQIGACKARLFLYDKPTDTLSQYIAAQINPTQSEPNQKSEGEWYKGAAPEDPNIFHYPIASNLTSVWQTITHASRPFTLKKHQLETAKMHWPKSIPWHASQGHLASTYACMKVGQKPIGFIGFAFRHQPALTDEQIEFVQALTNQATLAVHLTRLAEQNQNAALTDERNRLAREIHDTLAQSFTGISLQLEAAKGVLRSASTDNLAAKSTADLEQAALPAAEALVCLDRASQLARQGLSEARRSVRALRAQVLETNTLPQAIQIVLQKLAGKSSLEARFHLLGKPYALPEDLQTNLLRICQEAITNALRHANAQHFAIALSFETNRVCLHITDDGQGCEITSFSDIEGFGLLGMRERALRFDGQFSFNSNLGKGTIIHISVPRQNAQR